MFTGIITDLGKLKKTDKTGFVFSAPKSFCKKLKNGTSVAINGTCLTVEKFGQNYFSVSVMMETLQKTMLNNIKPDDLVNLELPVTMETFLSGHIVQGHIDGTGHVVENEKDGNSHILKIKVSNNLQRYIVKKGSVALNGISLTVISATKKYFTVGIIPFTWANTMLHQLHINDAVNIETDILAKYLEKFNK